MKTFMVQGRFGYWVGAETEEEAREEFWKFVNGNWSLGVNIDSDIQVYEVADLGDQS